MRNLIFISHANPEQNDFARWLGLQLVKEGYPIWSDITKLVGGEFFWDNIEEAIRNYAIKFLFVLSRASNNKQGTLDELHLSRTVARQERLKDFIIPLRVDDLPFDQTNVAIHRLNVIDFTHNWAGGLALLLKKLANDNIIKDSTHISPSTVTSWWRSHFEGSEFLQLHSEKYISNWFPFSGLPETIFVHTFLYRKRGLERSQQLAFPAYPIRNQVISFASAEDLKLEQSTTTLSRIEMNAPQSEADISKREMRTSLVFILHQAWLKFIHSIRLPLYELAQARYCTYFTQEMFHTRLQTFEIPDLQSGRRSLVGSAKDKYWHFAISADVYLEPFLVYAIKPHVLFSDDGKTIWGSKDRLHRARRSICKNWWNPHWRDRILASMYYMSQCSDSKEIRLHLSPDKALIVSIKPLTFDSPISYDESVAVESLPEDIDDNEEDV